MWLVFVSENRSPKHWFANRDLIVTCVSLFVFFCIRNIKDMNFQKFFRFPCHWGSTFRFRTFKAVSLVNSAYLHEIRPRLAKDAVCLFRHPSVVYALANLHRGPRGSGALRTTPARRARAGGHNHMRPRTYCPPPRAARTSFIAIVRVDRPLPHRVEMLSLSDCTHK